MTSVYKAVKLTERVWWVGAIDWRLRDFHGYSTRRGTTYNAYLILADKVTLVDTVKAPFLGEMLARISELIDPAKIEYIISNHSEMDHSGSLPKMIELAKPRKVFASVNGVKALANHFHLADPIEAVKDGQTINLGGAQLTFLETPMLHWPDSMCTYLAGDAVLFSQDGFGMHLASSERFDHELDEDVMYYEAAKYYANILLPYSPLIAKLLARLEAFEAPIEQVAPDHGPIWKEKIGWILGLYAKWARQQPTGKAVIVYDTMWQSTAMMADAIAEGLRAGGAVVKVLPLAGTHRSDVVTELLEAGAVLVGSPTINNGLFPTVADMLTYLKGLKPANLIGAAFGSYGWGGNVVKQISETLRETGVEVVHEGVRVKYVPDDQALQQCYSLGLTVAEKLKQRCGAAGGA